MPKNMNPVCNLAEYLLFRDQNLDLGHPGNFDTYAMAGLCIMTFYWII